MRRFNRVRVQLFVELIKSEMKKQVPSEDRAIVRRPGNPMVRGQGTHRSPEKPSVPKQIDLI
jgi:hypothetical protein